MQVKLYFTVWVWCRYIHLLIWCSVGIIPVWHKSAGDTESITCLISCLNGAFTWTTAPLLSLLSEAWSRHHLNYESNGHLLYALGRATRFIFFTAVQLVKIIYYKELNADWMNVCQRLGAIAMKRHILSKRNMLTLIQANSIQGHVTK